MQVKLVGTAGFCWGVKRALRLLEGAAGGGKRVVTYGPVIHNTALEQRLAASGLRPIARPDEADEATTVAIGPHGILAGDHASLEGRGASVLDLTCPHVTDTRKAIYDLAEKGVNLVIAGNRDHGEVAVLKESAKTKVWVVTSSEEASTVAAEAPLALVAQSTFGPALFEDIEETLRGRFPKLEVVRTLCGATEDRQDDARRLAEEADVLIVVGPYHSGNARRLAEMSRDFGKQTFHVEVPEDLQVGAVVEQARLARRQLLLQKYADDPDRLREATADPAIVDREVVIGITAGASTPEWVTRAVVDHIVGATKADLVEGLPKDLAAASSGA